MAFTVRDDRYVNFQSYTVTLTRTKWFFTLLINFYSKKPSGEHLGGHDMYTRHLSIERFLRLDRLNDTLEIYEHRFELAFQDTV